MERGNPWTRLGPGSVIAPSLLAGDFARIGEQIDQLAAGGIRLLHVDIMDGHFVPNLSMGPGFVKSIRRYTSLPLDVHLMVTDPGAFLGPFAEAGADSITFHIESAGDPAEMIGRLHEAGLGAGITLRPGTSAEALRPVVADVDLVLVMTVEPGYGGQGFLDNMLAKIAAVRGMLSAGQRVEVDGGVNPRTARLCRDHGADVFVAGTDILGSRDIPSAVARLREAIA